MTSRFRRIRHIRATLDSGPWSYAETHAQAIDSAWRTATTANPALFDGEVLVITHREIDGEVFEARYRPVRYSQFLHYMRHGEPDGASRNGFAVAGLTGSDGALVMGIMGGHTANAGRIYFPGGTPDPDDVVDGRVDLEGSVMRELTEETGLTAEEVRVEPGFWLHEDEKRSAFIKVLHSPLPAVDLRDTILARVARQAEPELAGLHIVRSHDDLRPDLMPPFQLAYAEWWLAGGREV
ncbi:NUDIX hydrolase [Phreatobacter cathodiphilus]|uniref:NUDIX hydrolase n=1 Tax=Phreatobacter cathodiphilus TaxID=1868589 RepID=A0A2S0N6K7_9HYPH|nr:NUDIX hydrolase [Phreatobacter cathodiphilus]AVO43789.1 NUDIX hydrolase [Phreatobacter cathodiphilus]